MMKRMLPVIFLGAGLSSASRLGTSSHHGVEELGDQIEFFAPTFPDREVLLQRKLKEVAKDYSPDLSLTERNSESSQDRSLAVSCSSGKAKVSVTLLTDAYGYETSYVIKDSNNEAVLNMPESGSQFSKSKTYTDDICLEPGQYTLRVKDKGADGWCANGSCGSISVTVDGSKVLDVSNNKSSWSVVEKNFEVMIFSGRFGGSDSSSSSQTFTGDSGFVDKTCYDTSVYMKIDKYGKETSFKITKKGSSSVVASEKNPLDKYESKTFDVGCLQPGDYTITVTDIDGICCKNGDGEFKLIVDGVELFAGGQFIGDISHDFKIGYDWSQGMVSRDWEYLIAHNDRRKDYHTRCTSNYCNKKYRALKWSQGLASDAQKYAKQLLSTCDGTGIKHEPGIEQGENLAKNKGSGQWGQLYAADKIVKRFVDNEAKLPWHFNAHLTQALWYATKYLGCAESKKTMSNGETCRIQVCRYAKAGNCEMGKFNSETFPNHEIPMMLDDTPCGPVCPPEGCYV